jgi:carotenoid cleavage dioxygenase
VARILLPERMGIGTHACWVEGDRLDGENRQPVLN